MSALKTITFIFLFSLLVFSFYQVFILSQSLYFLRKEEGKVDQLSKEIKKLEVELSEKTSLSNLDQFLTNSDLAKAKNIKFIEVFESGVAAK